MTGPVVYPRPLSPEPRSAERSTWCRLSAASPSLKRKAPPSGDLTYCLMDLSGRAALLRFGLVWVPLRFVRRILRTTSAPPSNNPAGRDPLGASPAQAA